MNTPLVLIGSNAISFRGYELPRKWGADWDYVGKYDDVVTRFRTVKAKLKSLAPISEGKKLVAKYEGTGPREAEIAWPGSLAEELYNLVLNDPGTVHFQDSNLYVPSLNVLYMLKMSHRYLKNSPHFLKTRQDIMFLRTLGAHIEPAHEEFYQKRLKATYTYNHPKLNVNKGEFFNGDGVDYKYDHDSIHRSVMRGYQPAYEVYKEDEAEVYCSKDLFYAAPEHVRLNGVLEEAMVLAIERSIVPHPGAMTGKQAFEYALMKVCTSITSGWFREYAWENYDKVIGLYDPLYVDKFWEDVKTGIVKEYEAA